METKNCSKCNELKNIGDFYSGINVCKVCFNEKRRQRYATDEEHRKKIIKQVTTFETKRVLERQKIKEKKEQLFIEEHGEGKRLCKYCNKVHDKTHFRHNRRKCKDCERDEPHAQLGRTIRAAIWKHVIKRTNVKKNYHTNEYLGCSYEEYRNWLIYNFEGTTFNFDNHSTWHIDHVIPVSRFDLTNEEQQLIAFNWRNTMPLLAIENLQKNNKIIPEQIEQHFNKLTEYHTLHNIEMPQEFINLYAKHLVVPENP
jgi:hypothetical protein